MEYISLEDKIEFIESSSSLEQVQKSGVLPDPDALKGYYFVSYSHKDYKVVFKHVLRLLEQGINLWYDRGLEAGKSWREDVKRKIYSYNCKGVICFLSANCIGSESLLQEYDMIRRFNKPMVAVEMNSSIFDSVEDAFVVDGVVDENAFGCWFKQLSEASEQFPALPNGKTVSKDIESLLMAIAKIKRRGVVSEDCTVEELIKVLRALPPPALFKFRLDNDININPDNGNGDERIAVLTGINDVGIKSVTIPQTMGKDRLPVTTIQKGSFANCLYLEEVTFPNSWREIEADAFYNCKRLTKVDLGLESEQKSDFEYRCLDLKAFDGCESLKELTIPGGVVTEGSAQYLEKITLDRPVTFDLQDSKNLIDVSVNYAVEIGENALARCGKLRRFIIPENCQKIDSYAFAGCTSLEELRFPSKIKVISKYACAGCSSLLKAVFDCEYTIIGGGAFKDCSKLRSVDIKNAHRIGKSAFSGCDLLEEVKLSGVDLTMYASAFSGCKALKTVIIELKKLKRLRVVDGQPQEVEAKAVELFPFAQKIYLKNDTKGFDLVGFGMQTSDMDGHELWVRV